MKPEDVIVVACGKKQQPPALPPVAWNVVSKREIDARSNRVFEAVADVLSNTLGPFGATTMIETLNEYRITKDGWNVLKTIKFNNPTEDNIAMLLVNIAQQVVRKVGDGSTSSVVAAYRLLQTVSEVVKNKKVRSKTLLDTLNRVSAWIVEEIKAHATHIDREGDFQEIYDLAYVSTNENAEIASLIQQAYQATRTPAIQFEKSRTANNELEIINGYQSKISFLDRTFINTDSELGVYTNVRILMIDHTVEREYHFDFIKQAINDSRVAKEPLLLIAPHFDKSMHETFASLCGEERSQTGRHHFLVGRAHLLKNHEFNMFKDLSAFLGAKIVTETVINEYVKKGMTSDERVQAYDPRLNGSTNDYIDTDVKNYIGRVGKVSLGKRFSLFQDLYNTDEKMLEQCRIDAENKLKTQEAIDEELNSINHDVVDLLERVTRLNCETAIIKAGGVTTLEKGANYDLLEDAVKASASAFKHGYNLGGNLAIVNAATRIQDNAEVLTELENDILNAIMSAFKSVLKTVLDNGDFEYDVNEIIRTSQAQGKCLNIVTGEYDGKVINPTMTDVEILKGTSSIVSLMLSSNQYISQIPNIQI